VDGRSYEIDLNARHAAEFRHRLGPFTDHARPVRSQRSRVTRRSAASRERSRQIRLWAEQRGFALSPHGRLPSNVIQQYDRENGADRSAEGPTRRRAGQRASSARQARKTSASARSPRRRVAPRGALRGRARQPAPPLPPHRDRSSDAAQPRGVRRGYNSRERDLWRRARVIVPVPVPPARVST
jgi:hypothetical protein